MTVSASPIDWDRFAAAVRSAHSFVLTSHVRPDCDALGSELGMADVLESLGKQVRVINADPVPPHISFIDPRRRVQVLGQGVTPAEAADCDCLLVLDTSSWAQLAGMGDVLRQTRGAKLVLDHHQSSDDLQAEVFRNTEAEATGRLVFEAAEKLGVQLSAETAMSLLAAITTDTGWFHFSSTNPTTFRIASRLVECGARPEVLYRYLYEQDSLARIKLIGRVLSGATVELGGRLIYIQVTRDDFAAVGAASTDTEDLINFTLRVKGTEVALIFIESAPGVFKVSFRSRTSFDCSQLARQFGGGGHKQAAGATLQGTLAEVQTRVLTEVRREMSAGG